jgi:hypothetical protein
MISSVDIAQGGTGKNGKVYPETDGPYIRIIWNTDSGNDDTWLEIRKFANLYESTENGIEINDFKIGIDYTKVADRQSVTDLQKYTTELSTSTTGIIDTLSAGIDSALSSNILNIKYLGHITVHADENDKRLLSAILADNGLLIEKNRVKNGSMFEVKVLNNSSENRPSVARYKTSDGLTLGHGDYIYIHKHGLDTYINASDIVIFGDNKNVYHANPVHKYNIAELYNFVIDNFAKLSGNNEISNDNVFLGSL